MNKLSKMVLGVAVSAMVLSGCKNQDVVAPTVTNPNQYPNGVVQKSINFTVQVIQGISNGGGRTQGLNGAQVTISQNGSTSTKTTGADGLAVFSGLNEGDVAVYVSANGYASYNYTTSVSDNSTAVIGSGNNTNQTVVSSASYQVPLYANSVSGVGTLFGNFNTSNLSQLVAASGFRIKAYSTNSRYQPTTFYTVVNSDGSFKFNNLIDGQYYYITLDTTINGVQYTANGSLTAQLYQTASSGEITANANTVTTQTNSSIKGLLYGAFTLVSVSGTNPVFSTTEAPATGVTVVLTSNNTGLTYSATTDATGSFSFTSLPSGYYNVSASKTVSYSYTVPGTSINYTTNQVFSYSRTIYVDGTNTPTSGAYDLQTVPLQ